MLDELKEDSNMRAGFEKCGIVPFNKEKVLERIPTIASSENIAQHLDNSLVELLNERRYGGESKGSRTKGRGRGKLPPGRSYTQSEAESSEAENEDEPTHDVTENQNRKGKKQKTKSFYDDS